MSPIPSIPSSILLTLRLHPLGNAATDVDAKWMIRVERGPETDLSSNSVDHRCTGREIEFKIIAPSGPRIVSPAFTVPAVKAFEFLGLQVNMPLRRLLLEPRDCSVQRLSVKEDDNAFKLAFDLNKLDEGRSGILRLSTGEHEPERARLTNVSDVPAC
jgi:hypothetical protein